jgi:hypothetical protein
VPEFSFYRFFVFSDGGAVSRSLILASQTFKIMQYARENRRVFIAVIAISWFWSVGATYLSQVPTLSQIYSGR